MLFHYTDSYPKGRKYVFQNILDFGMGDAIYVSNVACANIGRRTRRRFQLWHIKGEALDFKITYKSYKRHA